jgi:phosphoribosylformylglycinamidine synthase
MEGEDREVIRENVVDMCERLLCNPVIHDYKINVIPQNMACGK